MIREFLPGDESAFRRLNEEWILRYFAMEAKDEEALADPHSRILDRGGRIFFAIHQGEAVGCCALVAISPLSFTKKPEPEKLGPRRTTTAGFTRAITCSGDSSSRSPETGLLPAGVPTSGSGRGTRSK